MRLSAFFFTLLGDDLAEAEMVSYQLLGMPTTVTVSPRSRPGGVEVTDRASGERPMRPMKDVGAELCGAA